VTAPPRDLETLLRALPVGVVLLDRQGRVALYNEAVARLSHTRPEAAEGRAYFAEVAAYADVPELAGAFRTAMEGGELDVDRELVFDSEGRSVDVRIRMRKLILDGEPWALLVIDDNTKLKSTERAMAKALSEAQDQAIRDPLTGLFNRRYVEAVLPAELARAQRYEVPLSLLVIDVDHFKTVNDRFGHPVGDRVLIRLAGVMRRVRRVSDTCARLGGEEFCIVLPHSSAPAALAAGERLLRVVRALRFEEEPELRVTVSIGVATTPGTMPASDFEGQVRRLMARADEALYEAKRSGRDRTVLKAD
jgi:photoactive yellow protein